MDQQPSDGAQLLHGLLGVSIAEAFLAGVLLQLAHAARAVAGEAFEDLRRRAVIRDNADVRNTKLHACAVIKKCQEKPYLAVNSGVEFRC